MGANMQPLPLISRLGFRAVASLLSPAGKRASLLVLTYHRVLAEPDPLLSDEPDVVRFSGQMNLLSSLFNVLPLSEAVQRLKLNSLPERAVCITFDDGYANNLEFALPILKARKLPATVFVSTGFIGGKIMWNDMIIEVIRAAKEELDLGHLNLGVYSLADNKHRRDAINNLISRLKYINPDERLQALRQIADHAGANIKKDIMMSESQLKELHHSGIELGAHTVNHPILSRLEDTLAFNEIKNSKGVLEDITGEAITCFAYPNGRPAKDYEARHVRMVKDLGFKSAVSTAWGATQRNSDVLQLPRIAPWDRTSTGYITRMLKAYLDPTADTV